MYSQQLSDLMAEAGFSQAALARHIDVAPHTVGRWVNGKGNVPKVVIMYLELKMENRRLGK